MNSFDLPPALGPLQASGCIRQTPEDFQVSEILGFSPGGEGEHLWLHLRKRGWNTTDLALWLARQAKLPLRSVGYSGLKDRQAVTDQWFSLHLPGKADPDFGVWPEGVELLAAVRHTRKLNRGTHRANAFLLRVRELRSADELEERLRRVGVRGVPNYFGEQRFGREQQNFVRGCAWLRGEGEAPRKAQLRSFWLSAVRSGLFNAVLAERVRRDCWDRLLPGDVCQPDDSRGLFLADTDPDADARAERAEIHPTAPLPGRDGMASGGACAELEGRILTPWQAEIQGLIEARVDGARRATRLSVRALEWSIEGDVLTLALQLPAGAFATSVLAELIRTGAAAA